MKLINFLEFQPLKEIMEKMKIDKDEKIEIERIEKIKIAGIWKELSSLSGLDIDINETNFSEKGYIKYKEFDKLVAYIRDQRYYEGKLTLRKFHIAYNCETLSKSRKSRDASKFKIIQNKSPEFTINILSEDGKENFSKSRRVEFKIKTTAEAHINDILEAGGFNETN